MSQQHQGEALAQGLLGNNHHGPSDLLTPQGLGQTLMWEEEGNTASGRIL